MPDFKAIQGPIAPDLIFDMTIASFKACEALLSKGVDMTTILDSELGAFFEDAGNFFIGLSEQISQNIVASRSTVAQAIPELDELVAGLSKV